jgi:hypothetical protein
MTSGLSFAGTAGTQATNGSSINPTRFNEDSPIV